MGRRRRLVVARDFIAIVSISDIEAAAVVIELLRTSYSYDNRSIIVRSVLSTYSYLMPRGIEDATWNSVAHTATWNTLS